MVRSSFMYIFVPLSLLCFFNFDRSVMTRLLSLRVMNRTITGRGSSSLAFRGFGSRWLMSMSFSSSLGSSWRTSLARFTTAAVVFSWSSLMPVILRLLRRPYCSRASFLSLSPRTSPWSCAMVASRSANAVFRPRTSSRSEATWILQTP